MSTRRKLLKKIIAFICALLVVSSAGWKYTRNNGWSYTGISVVSADPVNTVTLDLSQGDIEIDSAGYWVGDDSYVDFTGTYRITGSNADTDADSDDYNNVISVIGGTHTIILDNIDIALGDAYSCGHDVCMMYINEANVTLKLVGANTISNNRSNGIILKNGANLTIEELVEGSGASLEVSSPSHNVSAVYSNGSGVNNIVFNSGDISINGCYPLYSGSNTYYDLDLHNYVYTYTNTNITVNGGSVNVLATYQNEPAIGFYDYDNSFNPGTLRFTVNGGTLYAGASNSSAIGTGETGSYTSKEKCTYDIRINGGSVHAVSADCSYEPIGMSNCADPTHLSNLTVKNASGDDITLHEVALGAQLANKVVTLTGLPAYYGLSDIKADAQGKVYLYYPDSWTGEITGKEFSVQAPTYNYTVTIIPDATTTTAETEAPVEVTTENTTSVGNENGENGAGVGGLNAGENGEVDPNAAADENSKGENPATGVGATGIGLFAAIAAAFGFAAKPRKNKKN